MLIAWIIQERVNTHDRRANKIFDALDYGKIYMSTGARFFGDNPEDLMMGVNTFQVRVVSFLKDKFSHRQMQKILKDFDKNRVGVQSDMTETREEVKEIARQVAKSYASMLRWPDSDTPSRRRRRR